MGDTITLGLIENVDRRTARYILHKVEDMNAISPDILKKATEPKKQFRKTLSLSDIEKKIVEKHGKATSLLMNCYIVMNREGRINEN